MVSGRERMAGLVVVGGIMGKDVGVRMGLVGEGVVGRCGYRFDF